ncbi:hypothetical protein B0H16DRAFT_1665957 [Mycena metata]|uniref:F-box domain-containing protein n=1 Tax=Mycena metata TaxID=1033252 RepID=A0AAD7HPJ4_9AGAR|nr:hypothetical protein B0H16DRAFT_1665957 [Mycena metata]
MPGPKNTNKNQKKNKNLEENKLTLNAQLGSLFMQLPREMRDEIYPHLFFSTRLVWGHRALGRIDQLRITSAPNALALLRSCRQVRAEIGNTWLQQVLFVFEDPNSMLDKLANIPTTTLALIRYARISGETDSIYYRTSQALKLLPGLALNRLTILGPRDHEVSYQTLSMLVRHGAGWKELYYLSHNSAFLAYPAGWQRALEARDGTNSGASVAIYTANAPRCPGAVLDPATRVAFTQTLPAGCDLDTYGTFEDAALMKHGEREKEVLVVVKRGRGVEYAEKPGLPYLEDGDIREKMPGKTWKEIKAALAWSDDEDDDYFGLGVDEREPSMVDKYAHVDDYVWPPLHFSNV